MGSAHSNPPPNRHPSSEESSNTPEAQAELGRIQREIARGERLMADLAERVASGSSREIPAAELDQYSRQANELLDWCRSLPSHLRATGPETSSNTVESFLPALPQMGWSASQEGRIEYLNPDARAYLGLAADAKAQLSDIVFPADLHRALRRWSHSIRSGEEFREELRLRRALDQTWRWHICRARPVATGRPGQWIGVCVDIDDRKHAEDALRQREDLFWTAIHEASIGVAFLTLDGRFVEANPACCRLNGYSEQELQQRTFLSVTHPDDRSATEEQLSKIADGSISAVTIQRRNIQKCGQVVWVRSTLSLARDSAGKPWRILAFNEDITDRQKALETLRERDEQLSTITRHAADALYLLDEQGRVTFMNPAAEDMFGWSREEVLGRVLHDVIHCRQPVAEGAQGSECRLGDVLKAGEVIKDHEDTFHRKDGSRVAVSCSNSPIWHNDRITAAVLMVHNITDQKKAEEERLELLRAEQQRNAQMAGLARAAVEISSASSLDGVLSALADRARELIGTHQAAASLAEGENWGQPFRVVSLSETYAQWREDREKPDGAGIYAMVQRLNRPVRMTQAELEEHPEYKRFAHQPHRHLPMRGWLVAPIKGKSGGNIGLVQLSDKYKGEFTENDESILTQLAETASIAAESIKLYNSLVSTNEALAQSERQFRRLAEAMPQLVWIARGTGEQEYFSARWYAYVGSTFEESRKGWVHFVHPEDRDAARARWDASLMTGQPLQAECRIRNADGQYRWFLVRALAIGGRDGKIQSWFGTCTDIDDQKRTEVALRLANEDLTQFAYAASHDLQEPLRMVVSYTQLLRRRLAGLLDEETNQFCDHVIEGAKRMTILLRDLLAYTDLDRDERPYGQVDSNRLVAETLETLRPFIKETGTEVEYGNLPPLWGRYGHFLQLFQNLIENAIKYRGEKPSRIRISAEAAGSYWRFRVQDNGIGIPPEYSTKIFGLFKRLHGKQVAGTGIGLAICAKVVQRYGGKIWVESEAGKGSSFFFTIPRRDV